MKKIFFLFIAVCTAHIGISQNFDDEVTITQKNESYPALRILNYQGLFSGGHPSIFMQNYGGTSTSPTLTPANRILGNITFAGYNGSQTVQVGRIHVSSTGNFSAGNYPAKMYFRLGGTNTCCGTPRMVIDGTTGNVGIGNSNPDANLTIGGEALQTYSLKIKDQVGRSIMLVSPTASTPVGQLKIFGTNSSLQLGVNSFPSIFHISGLNGNIGIGTTSPGNSLDIEKNHDGSSFLEITNRDTGTSARRGVTIGDGTAGGNVSLISTSQNYNAIASWSDAGILTTGSQLGNGLVIRTSTGNVRFQPSGTTDKALINQEGKLSLVSNSGALGDIISLYGNRLNGASMYGFGIETNGGTLYSKTVSSYNWYIGDNADQGSSAIMKLNSQALEVDGKVRSEEVKVEVIDWPDYVFADDYNLRELSEVETFIKEKNHLPEIPSEAEVSENGIELGKMNAKLLKKVEELTLYLIEQNKKIEELEKKLEKIESDQ